MDLQVEYIDTRSGDKTLKVNGYFIHSKYNPIEEAKRLADQFYKPHHTHILFGYGCGYLVDALLNRFSFNEKLIVIDPLLDSEIKVKKEHESLKIFNSTAIDVLEVVINTFGKGVRTKYNVVFLPNYDKIFPHQLKDILKKVKDIQVVEKVNDNTLLLHGEQWQKNFIDNLLHLSNDFNLKLLEKAYSCPIVIASGGPSLTKQLPIIRKIRENIILISAGTTTRSLVAEEIYPDYVVSLDGSEKNGRSFENLYFDRAKLIYAMQSYPTIREKFKSRGYAANIAGWSIATNYLKNKLKIDLPLLPIGTSVAHLVFAIAQYITTGPIAFIGQDLAYTNNMSHAANNIGTQKLEEEDFKKDKYFLVDGFYGDKVWTDYSMYSMKLHFERMVQDCPNPDRIFNCTEGGAKIEGFNQLAFNDFCEKFVKIEAVEVIEHEESLRNQFNLKEAFINQIEEYKKLISIIKEALNILEKNHKKNRNSFDKSTLKKLEKLEEKSIKIFHELPIEQILSPIVLKTLNGYLPKENETAEESYLRVYNQNKELYTEMIARTERVKSYIEGKLKQLEE